MEPNKGDCLEKINRQLREKGLMELDSIGDHTKGEIEILEIVEINEDPNSISFLEFSALKKINLDILKRRINKQLQFRRS